MQKITISIISKTGDFEYLIDEAKKSVLGGNFRGFDENEDESYSFKVEDIEGEDISVDYLQKEDINNDQEKLQDIQKKFNEIETLYNSLGEDSQQKILGTHSEQSSLPYCVRRGKQAIDEYLK